MKTIAFILAMLLVGCSRDFRTPSQLVCDRYKSDVGPGRWYFNSNGVWVNFYTDEMYKPGFNESCHVER